jgi:uncharacterized membrane protein YfcA
MELLGYAASFVMGLGLGLMGGGGSILTVPIMVYLFGLTPTIATGYSLFVVGITAMMGSALYLRKGEVQLKLGLLFAVPSIVGVNISRGVIIPNIPDIILELNGFALTKEILIMATFAALMIVASYPMIKGPETKKSSDVQSSSRVALVAFYGLIVGIIAGFVGAGGGFMIIPALVLLAGLKMRLAVGTSLMIIALQSLFGFAGDVSRGMAVDWTLLTLVAALAIAGVFLGSVVSKKVQEHKLKTGFGWFVLLTGSVILIEQLVHFSFR